MRVGIFDKEDPTKSFYFPEVEWELRLEAYLLGRRLDQIVLIVIGKNGDCIIDCPSSDVTRILAEVKRVICVDALAGGHYE